MKLHTLPHTTWSFAENIAKKDRKFCNHILLPIDTLDSSLIFALIWHYDIQFLIVLQYGSKGTITFLFKDAMYLLLNKAYISKFVHMCVYLKTPLTKGKE